MPNTFVMHFKTAFLCLLSIVCLAVPTFSYGVDVYSPSEAFPKIRFEIEVEAVLAKAGCNMGACHGNLKGKGGFKLSLRGQTPADDYRWLQKEHGSRRLDLFAPAQSLILQKPTSGVSHQGGTRFKTDSLEYSILHRWLEAGAPGPQANSPQVTNLIVTPLDSVVRAPRDSVQLQVLAEFTDGTLADVTALTVFEPSNLVAEVTSSGLVKRLKDGESTIGIRFLEKQLAVRVAFMPRTSRRRIKFPSSQSYIDDLVFAKLKKLGIQPSEVASDSKFIRRAYLDALGILPTGEEAQAFVQDQNPHKRAVIVEALLNRPEFNDRWALIWSDLLRNEEKVLDTKGVEVYHQWIRESFEQRKPLDQFVRELIVASGSTYEVPNANYWRANRAPDVRAETTARTFLGVRLQCAKCHNHPFDRWTQDDYYDWATVFSGIQYEEVDKNKRSDKFDKNEFVGEQLVKLAYKEEYTNARTKQPASPRFLGRTAHDIGIDQARLDALAEWMTSAENQWFVKSQVNRIWFHIMGRGLVEPVDDLRVTNPPANPELLEALADDFVASGFDVRKIVSRIMNSTTYQLSATPNATNQNDQQNYSRAIVKRLDAEVLLDAQNQAIGVPAKFNGYELGLRAGQIPGVRKVKWRKETPSSGDLFLATFGKPERMMACECERSNETTLNQVFFLVSDKGIGERMEQKESRVRQLAESELPDVQIVELIYWSALSRAPNSEELQFGAAYLANTEENVAQSGKTPPTEATVIGRRKNRSVDLLIDRTVRTDDRLSNVQDLTWALLNAKEFVFRH